MKRLLLIAALLAAVCLLTGAARGQEVYVRCPDVQVEVLSPPQVFVAAEVRSPVQSKTPTQTTTTMKTPTQTTITTKTPIQTTTTKTPTPNGRIRDRFRRVTRTRLVEREGPELGGILGHIVRGLVGRRLD